MSENPYKSLEADGNRSKRRVGFWIGLSLLLIAALLAIRILYLLLTFDEVLLAPYRDEFFMRGRTMLWFSAGMAVVGALVLAVSEMRRRRASSE